MFGFFWESGTILSFKAFFAHLKLQHSQQQQPTRIFDSPPHYPASEREALGTLFLPLPYTTMSCSYRVTSGINGGNSTIRVDTLWCGIKYHNKYITGTRNIHNTCNMSTTFECFQMWGRRLGRSSRNTKPESSSVFSALEMHVWCNIDAYTKSRWNPNTGVIPWQ